VDRDTPVSRTPTVGPGSLARECALLRERRARGPQKLLGPPMARVNARSEGHVKMQGLQTRGATAAGEMKWLAVERCANASIPALRFDALTLAAPLKYSLLDTSGTSPSSSSATSSSTLPQAMDPSAPSAAGSTSGMKRRGRPLGSRNKTKIPARWTPGAGGPLRLGAPMRGEANRAASGTSSALTLRGPAPGGALNAPSPVVAAPAPRASGSIDRALWEVEAALGPLPRLRTARGHRRRPRR
jgi:hypothetical protein